MAESRRNRKPQESLRVLLEHLDEGVTGCLSLRDGEGADRRVYVMQGEILAAHGPDDDSIVVRRLLNNGAVTERQSEEYGKRLSAGERLDEILFGQIPDELLLDVLTERFHQNVLDFLLAPGHPEFEQMDAIFVDNIQIGHDSRTLLRELEMRCDRIRVLRARSETVAVRAGTARPTRLEEARLLDLVDTPTRLADLLQVSPYEQGITLDLIGEMLTRGTLAADGAFPAADDEPTEISNGSLEAQLLDMPSSALEPADPWTEDIAEEVRARPAFLWPDLTPAEIEPTVELEELTDHGVTVGPSELGTELISDRGSDTEGMLPPLDDVELRHAAEVALRIAMDAEMAREAEEEGSVELTDAGPSRAPSRVVPPGFSYEAPTQEEFFFRDHDRELGRGGADGTFIGLKDEVVVLRGPDPAARPADEEAVIEAQDLESLPEEQRTGIRALSFGAPQLEEDEAYNAFEIVNEALREISHVLDTINGPGAGRAFVQLLLEGTPAEFSTLFRAVEARKDGALPIDQVLKNLSDRPRSEHRQMVHRGVEDLVERALTLSCEELDDDAADHLAERVLRYQRQLGF